MCIVFLDSVSTNNDAVKLITNTMRIPFTSMLNIVVGQTLLLSTGVTWLMTLVCVCVGGEGVDRLRRTEVEKEGEVTFVAVVSLFFLPPK